MSILLNCRHSLCKKYLQSMQQHTPERMKCPIYREMMASSILSQYLGQNEQDFRGYYFVSKTSDVSYDAKFRFMLVGDSKVGKSCLTNAFLQNTFKEDYLMTIGVECGFKTLDIPPYKARIEVWDMAGDSRFRPVASQFYRDATILVLCFDVCDPSSLNSLINLYHYNKTLNRAQIGRAHV